MVSNDKFLAAANNCTTIRK